MAEDQMPQESPKLSRKDLKRKLDFAVKDLINGRVLLMQCAEALVEHHADKATMLVSVIESFSMLEQVITQFDEGI